MSGNVRFCPVFSKLPPLSLSTPCNNKTYSGFPSCIRPDIPDIHPTTGGFGSTGQSVMGNWQKGYSVHSSRDRVAKFISRAAAALPEGDDAWWRQIPATASGWLLANAAAFWPACTGYLSQLNSPYWQLAIAHRQSPIGNPNYPNVPKCPIVSHTSRCAIFPVIVRRNAL